MSVDQTISELSQTLAQLGNLVGHINGQINGITSRINLTLDNFDQAVANVAKDAGSVTYQVGDSVSQVPNAWVFYMLFIALIVVFILLSFVLILNMFTKAHAIYAIISRAKEVDTEYISSRDVTQNSYTKRPSTTTIPVQYPPSNRGTASISIDMESEPRRPGNPRIAPPPVEETPQPYQRRHDDVNKYNVQTATTNYTRSLEV